MSVGPVYWASYPGELVEEVMAVLLLQERPRAWHRKPSSGDGGVDVVEPVDGGYHVYQIKKFVDALSDSEKRQIEKSFDDVRTDPRLDKPVVHWSLVVPRDQTSGNEEWFRDFTGRAAFDSDWLGEVFWHSEASKYRYVIDYFLENGKERVNQRVQTLLQLMRDSENPVRPVDVVKSLGDLYTELNSTDPHYRYDLQVTGTPPVQRSIPGLMMTSTRQAGVGCFVTVDVIARYVRAEIDRPIGGSMTLRILDSEAGIDLREAYQAHIDYGRAFDVPAEAVTQLDLNAPGGLAEGLGDSNNIQIRIGPRTPANAEQLWIDAEVASPDTDTPLAGALIAVTEQNVGTLAVEAKGVDPSGLLTLECRIHTPEQDHGVVQYSAQMQSVIGLPVRKIFGPYRFLMNMHPPNKLRVEVRGAFARLISGESTLTEESVPNWEIGLHYIELLMELQRHTATPLIVSDVVSNDDWTDLYVARALFRGETLESTWSDLSFEIPEANWEAAEGEIEANHRLIQTEPFTVPNAGTRVMLGLSRKVLTGAMLKSVTPGELGYLKVVLEPGPDAGVEETLFQPPGDVETADR